MNSLVKNLKKQLTCSICLDTNTEPKTISCLHTFCCECLERHARVSQRQGKFRCPECQAEIDLPRGNRFDLLPNSFLHKSLLGVLEAEYRRAIPRQQQETCSQHTEEEYDITAPRVRRVFVQFASPKTTEAMRLTCLKKQCKRRRKTSCRLSRPSRKRQTCFEQS